MVSLLDVNILIALVWPTHPSHGAAEQWFARHAKEGWATCPMTQAGFVRVLSSPAFSPYGPTTKQAQQKLGENVRHPAHRFWPDSLQVPEALAMLGIELVGHRQVTDAYLLGLALHNKGRFVTLDKSVAALLPDGAKRAGHLETLT
jgi:toxin-antitoxin system PIN domain toxin